MKAFSSSLTRAVWPGQALRLAATLGLAIGGGLLATHWHVPLPWVLGSMLGVACISMAGGVYRQPVKGRKAAQIYIGTALGLYFTPVVIAQVLGLSPWITLGAIAGIVMSALSARLLQRMVDFDGPTAIYAVALGASAEMSVQAQRAGADGAMVASAHVVRIILVTTTASIIAWASGAVPEVTLSGASKLSWSMTAGLLLCAGLLGAIFQRVRLPNPWVLGALLVAGVCASNGLNGRLPELGMLAAQLVIGWGLGQNMTPSFFRRAPRALAAVTGVTLAILAVCMALAVVISKGAGLPIMTAFLSMAPGGMTEMGVMSKALGLGAPVVIAFHLLRILFTIFLTQPMARWMLAKGWVRP